MAKIAEQYMALKFSKLVKDDAENTFTVDTDLNEVIASSIEEILKEAGEVGIVVEVVEE